MLAHLDGLVPPWTTIEAIAEAVGRSRRQTLAAVRALESRDLVGTRREELRYEATGRLIPRQTRRGGVIGEPVLVKEGEPWPYRPGYVVSRDTTFYPSIRGVHGLLVWSVDRREWWAGLTVEQRKEQLAVPKT